LYVIAFPALPAPSPNELAMFERLVSQIVDLKFDQVERDQRHLMIAYGPAGRRNRKRRHHG
jgi:hypothetical protein